MKQNKEKIEQAINSFKFNARPSHGNHSEPATIDDINRVIKYTAKLAQSIAKILDD